MNAGMMVCQLQLDVLVADLAFDLDEGMVTCVLMQREGLSNIFFWRSCFCSSSFISRFKKWKGVFVSSTLMGLLCRYCFWKMELRYLFSPQYLLPYIVYCQINYKYYIDFMTFFESVFSFCVELLVFYIPVVYTFKYLMANDNAHVKAILKFWVILSFHYLLMHLLEFVVKGYLLVVLNLGALAMLNWDNFKYAEMLYDKLVAPLYRDNQAFIQKCSDIIEKLFEKNSEALKSKVASSAGDKIKGFMGEVLVGVLNPSSQKSKPVRESREQRDSDKEEEDDQE